MVEILDWYSMEFKGILYLFVLSVVVVVFVGMKG